MDYIRLEHIYKIFGEVKANADISLVINRGEVLSILGENGSGKTTLLNVLGGIYQQDDGKIFINDELALIRSPKDAFHYGIGMVHQHYELVEAFSAIENVVLGLSKKALLGLYDRYDEVKDTRRFRSASLKESAKRVLKLCELYGFVFEPNKIVHDMSIAEKQTLEIVKMLFRGVDTLILDEPTAVLTPQETRHLFTVIRNMKAAGKTVIIITHKLDEVMEISDRVALLRKGELIDVVETAKANKEALVEGMVGKAIDLDIHRSDIARTGERLIVDHLTVMDKEGQRALDDVSFTLYGSEILGVAGVSGSGQRELLDAISGLAKNRTGSIVFHNPKKDKPVTFFHKNIKQIRALSKENKFYWKDGETCDLTAINNKELTKAVNDGQILFYEDEIIDLTDKQPLEIRNLGIKLSFVPEDRLGMGLVGNMNVVDNMLLRSYRKGKGRLVHRQSSRALAQQIIAQLDVKTPSLATNVGKLSGGNIQKILVGREIASRPKILMVAYPVRGLDIRSSQTIYSLLNQQKEHGTAVIYVGEDLDAMLAVTDRIMVLCGGKITGIVDSRKATKEEVGLLMSMKKQKEERDETVK